MSVLPVGFGSAVAGGYQIERSLRFNSADSAYLNRTPGSAGNLRKWTWSGWVKRSALGTRQGIFGSTDNAGGNYVGLEFIANDKLAFDANNNSIPEAFRLETNAVFRDPSAWYHIVVFFDTAQVTASNRAAIYINGVLQTYSTATYMPQNYDGRVNTTNQHNISSWLPAAGLYFSGYLTEINFIDGQALTPSDFGETDTNTGVWKPKAYSGTYGTNGFYLKFADNSGTTSTTLGKDSSGNGNNWTPNNFSVTAGTGNDSLVDTPTQYGTDTGSGGEVRGNYATFNPLKRFTANVTLSNGNLTASDGSSTSTSAIATMSLPASGKWYWEITVSASVSGAIFIGACPEANAYGTAVVQTNGSYRNNGTIYNTASVTQTSGATYTTNDVIGVAVDVDNGTVQFYKNGTAQGATPSFSFTALSVLVPFIATDNAAGTKTVNCNFGQRAFEKWNGSAYVANTAPSGFKALCTTNLTTPTIGATSTTQANDYFDVTLYAGNNTAGRNVTNSGSFQPDFVWIKNRSGANGNILTDAVRGVTKTLVSDSTTQELTVPGGLTAFNSNGFQVGYDGTAIVNATGSNYVGWQWKANGAGSSNTAGSITSTVSANTTSGFSIVTYTGTGANATVGHGLGATPAMILVKNRDSGAIGGAVYHTSMGATKYLKLFQTTTGTDGEATDNTAWNGSSPTFNSTVFSVGSLNRTNSSQQMVAYCFAPVAGYSAFGNYTGNGAADGPFVYTGFRPAFVMVKNTVSAATSNWVMKDDLRAANYNPATGNLYANLAFAEDVTATVEIDLLSNGFKARGTYAGINGSTNTIIYMAFAESPFKYSLAR